VPTHDRPDTLVDAVESVAAQTYDRIELAVVDDGSTADVPQLLEELSLETLERVRVIEHGESKGANAARNAGVRAANGDYVAFLDDDDRWLPEKIERQVEAIRNADDDVAIVYTGQRLETESGAVANVVTPTEEGPFLANLARGAYFGPFSTVLVDADAFEWTGSLDEEFPCWQDREWYLRLAHHADYVSIPEPLTVRHCTPGSVSSNYEGRRDVAYPRLLERHGARLADHDPELEGTFRATLAKCMGAAALRHGHYRESLGYLLHSLRQDPTTRWTYVYLGAALGGPATHALARTAKRWVERFQDSPEMGSEAPPEPPESTTVSPTDGD